MGTLRKASYSSSVDIYLLVDGERFSIAQVGPNSFIPADPIEIPVSTRATIVIEVDGRKDRHIVMLYHGASKDQPEPVKFF